MDAVVDWVWAHPWIALALLFFTPLADIVGGLFAVVAAAIFGFFYMLAGLFTGGRNS